MNTYKNDIANNVIPKAMKKIIINEELRLKEVELSDAPAIFNIINSERKDLRLFLPFVDNTREVSDTESYIKSVLGGGKMGLDYVFTILYNSVPVGLIGFKETDDANKSTEMGYWLSEHFRGKGLVTQSCRTLIHYAFTEMGMNRIQLKIAVCNAKSISVALRLGFTLEGKEREGELLQEGFTDLFLYSLLKSEW